MNQITALQIAHQNGGTSAFMKKCEITDRAQRRHFRKMLNGHVKMLGYELLLICKHGHVSPENVKIDNCHLSLVK